MPIFKIPFLFYFWNLMLFPDKKAWQTCNQSWIFIIFRIYLSLSNSTISNVSFFCSLLLKLLLFRFCKICCGTFFGQPGRFLSLLIILNMFFHAVLLLPFLNGYTENYRRNHWTTEKAKLYYSLQINTEFQPSF